MADRKEQGRLQLYKNQGFEEGGNRPRFSGKGQISKAMLQELIAQFKDGTNLNKGSPSKRSSTRKARTYLRVTASLPKKTFPSKETSRGTWVVDSGSADCVGFTTNLLDTHLAWGLVRMDRA